MLTSFVPLAALIAAVLGADPLWFCHTQRGRAAIGALGRPYAGDRLPGLTWRRLKEPFI
jgi:hypothetical protein